MESQILKKRIFALIIDLLFISILVTIFSSFISKQMLEFDNTTFLNRKWLLTYNINFIISLLYFLMFDLLSNGVSLGKKIMNLRIVSETDKLSLKSLILRTILKLVFVLNFLLPFTIVFYLIKNAVFYDKIMKTNVVK